LIVTNEGIVPTGAYDGLWTALLLGETNTGSREVSIQVSHVSPGGEQSLHRHPESQCYYILEGRGTMIVDEETREVGKGDAVFIPGGSLHGIRNGQLDDLVYLTANQAFGREAEARTWSDPR